MHEKDLVVSLLLDFYGELLSERQRDAVDLYYNEDLSLAEIAENTGITRQGVRDSISKAKEQLYSFEDKLGLAGKFREMNKRLSDIVSRLENISNKADENSRAELNEIIKEAKTITL